MDKSFTPKVFISYAWASKEYANKVHKFAAKLRDAHINVVLDTWDMEPGNYINTFMDKCVKDKTITNVLILMDPVYAEKADNNIGGVGYEAHLIENDKIYKEVSQRKYIPRLFQKDENNIEHIPKFLQNRLYYDLTIESEYGCSP